MPDLAKASGQDMLQEATYELLGTDRQRLALLGAAGSILIDHLALPINARFDRANAAIIEAHSLRLPQNLIL